MAISRVTTWIAGQVLTASALNGEFNNIIDNALSLISPLTADLDFNGNDLVNLNAGTVGAPGLSFNSDSDLGVYRIAANQLGISAGGTQAAAFTTSFAQFIKLDGKHMLELQVFS